MIFITKGRMAVPNQRNFQKCSNPMDPDQLADLSRPVRSCWNLKQGFLSMKLKMVNRSRNDLDQLLLRMFATAKYGQLIQIIIPTPEYDKLFQCMVPT